MSDATIPHHEVEWSHEWLEFCDRVATFSPFLSNRILRRLTVNAPVILLFVAICTLLHIFVGCWSPSSGRILGVHDTWNTSRIPWQYTSLVTHIFAHSDFGHLRGNMTHLLLVGPGVEHAFGSRNVLKIMVIVAITSAFAHILIGNVRTHQLGASGVVFACILLNSIVSAENGKIPLSFVLTAILYLGEEFMNMLPVWSHKSATSHHAHLTGGIIGAMAGFYIHKQRRRTKTKSIVDKWLRGMTVRDKEKKKI